MSNPLLPKDAPSIVQRLLGADPVLLSRVAIGVSVLALWVAMGRPGPQWVGELTEIVGDMLPPMTTGTGGP